MIYVDDLANYGKWRHGQSCHMYTDNNDLSELHALASKIGLKRSWFQANKAVPHYDLTANKREQAIKAGAQPVEWRHLAEIMKQKREESKIDAHIGHEAQSDAPGYQCR